MRYFLSDPMHPLKYISCGNLISYENFLHHRRNLDVNVLIMVIEGTLYLSQGGVPYEVGPNQYLLLKSQEEHFGYQASPGRLSYLWIHFYMENSTWIHAGNASLEQNLESMRNSPDTCQLLLPEYGNFSVTQKAPLLFHQLLDLSRQEMLYSSQIMNYALNLLAMEITREFMEFHSNRKKQIHPKVTEIMEWIKANYHNAISISQLAEEFGYNPDYLSALFHRSTGLTLIQYINKIRIDSSKNLLANNDITMKEAAYSCGYQDEKYYMKLFREQEGMTPSQYKKAFYQKMFNEQKDV